MALNIGSLLAGRYEITAPIATGGMGEVWKARIQGIQVAGKTGTAQNSATDHAWFVGFAPADHPKIAVAVFVKNGGATGGDISAPVARQVIQAYLSGHGG